VRVWFGWGRLIGMVERDVLLLGREVDATISDEAFFVTKRSKRRCFGHRAFSLSSELSVSITIAL
jgi:hypothetical protein